LERRAIEPRTGAGHSSGTDQLNLDDHVVDSFSDAFLADHIDYPNGDIRSSVDLIPQFCCQLSVDVTELESERENQQPASSNPNAEGIPAERVKGFEPDIDVLSRSAELSDNPLTVGTITIG
jgi:hypothetical protein